MSQCESETLNALEQLMEEFFSAGTSNGRKRDIEAQLNTFSSQRDSWKLCIFFTKHTSSQYVSMYALSTIESVINRQWNSLEWSDKAQLKGALCNFLFEQDNTAPGFLRNKLAKLLVDIARFDWPHFYPDFFTNILQILQSPIGRLLGLILLRTTSEEFMNPRPDVSSYRKDELSRLLEHNIPQVFQILASILESLGNKQRHNATATPPPSPTTPSTAPDHLAQQISAASFRPDSKAVTRETLATIQHLFTWAPLNQIPVQIVTAIFNFTNVTSYAQEDDDMCVLAMSTLNELLYRKCVPPGSERLFVQIYQHTIALLKDITFSSGKSDILGSDFIEKLSELLALLVEQHLWRLESEPGFSAIDFLNLLFNLTMQLGSVQCYLRCLAVWAAFIKQIKPQSVNKYSDALLSLVMAVLNKMQFTCNFTQLEEIGNDESDDNTETEWQIFKNTSIETIALVADFAPIETFSRVLVPWKNASDIYCHLEGAVDNRNCSLKLDYSENQRLHCILRDLSSLTQTLARLSSCFIEQDSDYFNQITPIIDSLLEKLIHSASLATNARFYRLKVSDVKLSEDFKDVHCQLLTALKTWLIWLNLASSEKVKQVNDLIDIVFRVLREPELPPTISHAAALLFLSLSSTIHPTALMTLNPVLEFLQYVISNKLTEHRVKEAVVCAFAGMLVRPWGELSGQDSFRRQQLIAAFFDGLAREFKEIGEGTERRRVVEVTGQCLPYLSSAVDHSKILPLNSKKLLYNALKSTIDHALAVLPFYSKYSEVNELLLRFFLNVLGVFQHHINVVFVKSAVDVFLQIAIRNDQKEFNGLDTLLQIFQLIVESPGSSYKSFLPGILKLCLEHVFPSLVQVASENPDCIVALTNLLHSVLLHRWTYFYVSQIRLGHSPAVSEDTAVCPDNIQNADVFIAVLQVFGQILLQPDINTFRTSINALEDLNTKWKMYHKGVFRENLMFQFLNVLLQTLLNKSHNLLTDDILLCAFNMAAVDFHTFYGTFLPAFLDGLVGLTKNQRDGLAQNFTKETDTPTFVLHLQRLVNDIQCFRLCNSSLPPGSVVL